MAVWKIFWPLRVSSTEIAPPRATAFFAFSQTGKRANNRADNPRLYDVSLQLTAVVRVEARADKAAMSSKHQPQASSKMTPLL